MVRRFTKEGTPYDEGPYTDDELFDIYQRLAGGVVAFTSGARRPPEPVAAPAPQQKLLAKRPSRRAKATRK